jgi:thiamine-monophosphate kinase
MDRLDEERQKHFVLAGGDDYELLFTAPSAAADAVAAAARAAGVSITRIGTIVADAGLVVIGSDGRAVDTAARAFDHFR